ESLNLPGIGVDGPEDERVEAVVHEPAERLDPPVGGSAQRLAGEIADRKLRPLGHGPVSDQPLQVEDPPNRARVTARLLRGLVDFSLAVAHLLASEYPERR